MRVPIVASASAPPPLLARQRAAILAVLLVGAALAWAAVLSGQGDATHGTMASQGSDGAALDLTMGMGAAAYLGMWVAMMAAMMFPAAAPMMLMFARLQQGRRARGRPYVPTAAFAAVYLGLWTLFGAAAFGLSVVVGELLAESDDVASTWGRVAGGALVAAGAYQLSPLKDRCLSACRGPLAFLLTSWQPGIRGAVRLGLRHGVFCVGCCWLLFVVLVVLGVTSVAAMLVVALVVFAEKTLPGGQRLARAAALAMIGFGVVGLAAPTELPTAFT